MIYSCGHDMFGNVPQDGGVELSPDRTQPTSTGLCCRCVRERNLNYSDPTYFANYQGGNITLEKLESFFRRTLVSRFLSKEKGV